MKKFSVLVLAPLLVLSCGKDDKRSSKYPALDGGQRSQFIQFADSSSDAVQAPLDLKKEKGGLDAIQSDPSLGNPKVRRQMVDRMQKSKCEVKSNFDNMKREPAMIANNGDYYLSVGGDTCPTLMHTRFAYNFKQSSVEATFNAKYEIKDAEFKKLNDVTAFNLSGSASGSGSQTSFEGKGAVNGTVDSTQFGQVKVEMTTEMKFDQENIETYTVLTITFPTYTAEIKVIEEGTKQNLKSEVYLNGEKLDPKQSKQIRRFAGVL